MDRPIWNESIGNHGRAYVRFKRHEAAWDFAHRIHDEVTQERFDEAYRLLNRCTRYALAEYNMDATETEHNVNLPSRKRKQEQLMRRRERLDAELRPYGCRLDRAWCIDNVYEWDFENNRPGSNKYLHFFD